jgi:hypothetical protein
MYPTEYQELVLSEAEKLASKMDLNYPDLPLEIRESLRAIVTESLWPEEIFLGFIPQA